MIVEIRQLSALTSEPTLVQYSHFGERIDELKTSEGWRELKKVTVREGFVAEGIERRFGGKQLEFQDSISLMFDSK